MFSKLIVVIPTRNRPALAKRALDSILIDQYCSEVEVVLSDNSEKSCYVELKLEQYEENVRNGSSVFRYIRPIKSLSMTEHWEWAYQKVSNECHGSHMIYLTDRMLFHSGYLKELVEILRNYPKKIVTYCYDRIYDDETPIKLMRLPRTGALYDLPSSWLVRKAANMSFPMCLPRMLNCAVPMQFLEEIGDKFENVFGSVSPDFNFCFKALAMQERILFYDKSLLINYGHNLSNGASSSRGVKSATSIDFTKLQGAEEINSLTPLPGIMSVGNAIVHEYIYVSNCNLGISFPDISRQKYQDMLVSEVAMFEEGVIKREANRVLQAHGVGGNRIAMKRYITNLFRTFILKILKRRAENLEIAMEFMKEKKAKTYRILRLFDKRYNNFIIKVKST